MATLTAKNSPANENKKRKFKPVSTADSNALNIQKLAEKIIQIKRKEEKLTPDEFDVEFNHVISSNAPTFSTMALFLRLARKFRRHYNTDSISLINTIGQQCGMSAFELLESVKCYRLVKPSSGSSGFPPYGFRFIFAKMQETKKKDGKQSSLKDCSPSVALVVKGLKLTCQLLESEIIHNSSTTLMQLGRTKASKSDPDDIGFQLPRSKRPKAGVAESGVALLLGDEAEKADQDGSPFTCTALLRVHLIDSFDTRIWSQVEHRFLCLHTVAFLFVNSLSNELMPMKTVGGVPSIDFEEFLFLSYQVTSDCTERKEFLRRITHICLLYPTKEACYNNRNTLQDFWRRRNDLSVGPEIKDHLEQMVPSNEKTLVQQMDHVFGYFRKPTARGKNFLPQGQNHSRELAHKEWWMCIRANVFRLYLDFPANYSMKKKLRSIWDSKRKRKNPKPQPSPKRRTMNPNRKPPSTAPLEAPTTSPTNNQAKEAPPSDLPNLVPLMSLLNTDNDAKDKADEEFEGPAPNKVSSPSIHCSLVEASTGNRTCAENQPKPSDIAQNIEKIQSSLPQLATNHCIVQRLRLALLSDLKDVDSELVIHHNDFKYHLHLSNFEIYLANHLKRYRHGRIVRKSGLASDQVLSQGDSHMTITRGQVLHIDKQANILHVARPGSNIIDESQFSSSVSVNIGAIIGALMDYNFVDEARDPDGVRAYVAAASELNYDSSGRPCPVGMGANGFLTTHEHGRSIRKMIGRLMLYAWDCSNAMLDVARRPGMAIRDEFSNRMKEWAFIPHNLTMGFEAMGIAFKEIHPYHAHHVFHYDEPNCSLPNSSYTTGMNMVVIDPISKKLYLLQFLFYYRECVTSYYVPFYKSILGICNHIESLLVIIEDRIASIYSRQQMLGCLPSPLDMSKFYMDDNLVYTQEEIGGGISLEVIEIPIGFSRIFSLSACIHVLQECRLYMNRRQLIELVWVASLLNTPVRYYYTMTKLLEEARKGELVFNKHPFFDWYSKTTELFGTWQGGPKPRFQCAGIGDIGEHIKENEEGYHQLDGIVDALDQYLLWVDQQVGKDEPAQLPIPYIREVMVKVQAEVSAAAGPTFGNFGHFRLGQSLNLSIGASLTQQGRHLRQMFFPFKGTASLEHMKDGCGSMMTLQQARQSSKLFSESNDGSKLPPIMLEDFDMLMHFVCTKFNITTGEFRDFMECALCESKHSRRLGKVDLLIKGVPLYMLNKLGQLIRKRYGMSENWEVVPPHPIVKEPKRKTQMLYHYSSEDKIAKYLARNVSRASWEVNRHKKRSAISTYQDASRVRGLPRDSMHYHFHHTIHCYQKSATAVGWNGMKVLENHGFKSVTFESEKAISFESLDGASELVDYAFGKMFPDSDSDGIAGELHLQPRDEGSLSSLSFYVPHKDKALFKWVGFIPLKGLFWTLVAMPKDHQENIPEDVLRDLSDGFKEFVSKLESGVREEVDLYIWDLKSRSAKDYKLECAEQVQVQPFRCEPGCILCFDASQLWHGTVTVNTQAGRDLLIIHTLQGSDLT